MDVMLTNAPGSGHQTLGASRALDVSLCSLQPADAVPAPRKNSAATGGHSLRLRGWPAVFVTIDGERNRPSFCTPEILVQVVTVCGRAEFLRRQFGKPRADSRQGVEA